MKEIIFLNFGNSSNFISSHFWNLNDEMFKTEDKFNIDNSILYNEYYHPRNIIFDFSENIRPYFVNNEKMSDKQKKEVEEEVTSKNQYKVRVHEADKGRDNKFLDLINEFGIDEEEYKQFEKGCKINDEDNAETFEDGYNSFTKKMTPNEIYKLPEDKIYDYLDFQSSVKNWNDFLQPKFHKNSLNEVRTADVDVFARGSYIKGYEFLTSDNFTYNYLENYEDVFRKYLEDCDRLETLHINVDFNSFWGGFSNSILETFSDSIPKVLKVIYGVDLNSSFYNWDDSFNERKFLNYIWYFGDLMSNQNSDLLFMPVYKHQNPGFIRQTYHHDFDFRESVHDPVYDFFYTSLCGMNLQSLYFPQRSKYFNNSSILTNMLHNTRLNFIESDNIFNLGDIIKNEYTDNLRNNGIIFNFTRNFRHKLFKWKKVFENSYRMNKFNSSIIHGFSEKHLILDEKIDGFLMKHSGINYTAVERFDLPLCFPRKIYSSDHTPSETFLNDLSLMTNHRPFPEFPIKYFECFPEFVKDFDLEVRKHLVNYDAGKYIEYKEKVESYYDLLDIYENFNDTYNLGIYRKESLEEDF